jgi:hydroxyacylglutathione hydrolase
MTIKQFYDKGLAHASYAIVSENKMILVDPSRDPKAYYDFAHTQGARIVGVIETHPHADFVSSHAEIAHTTGATIYVSQLAGAAYKHTSFDDGDVLILGGLKLRALNTPGHSPDSICIVVTDEQGKDYAVFTGDTLFVGDVGRPDLRENVGNIQTAREQLAQQMYRSTRQKLMVLGKDVLVYPAHGPGSLCGKGMSPELWSTIGEQLESNYALQEMSESEFVDLLLDGQPFVPKYFEYDVELNKKGAISLEDGLGKVNLLEKNTHLEQHTLIIDTRPQAQFKASHITGALNIQDGGKFETWLGSIVAPNEPFYLLAADEDALEIVIHKTAKIGYETLIKGAMLYNVFKDTQSPLSDIEHFKQNMDDYTIVDIRNWTEIADGLYFEDAIPMPLPELRERAHELPTDKPIMIHCVGGYRSAAGQSIVAAVLGENIPVYDMSDAINELKHAVMV